MAAAARLCVDGEWGGMEFGYTGSKARVKAKDGLKLSHEIRARLEQLFVGGKRHCMAESLSLIWCVGFSIGTGLMDAVARHLLIQSP